ncbi:MAG: N-acetylglucosamine-6-phosphate deacetylase [Eubacteriales bacterium]|nr:N-acetylglucosamine-6-phosphate deacetylase [Eubacteriales bacterium]
MTKIINGRLIRSGRVQDGLNVILEDGRIAEVTARDLPSDTVIDARGQYVSPGFIDIHTHGGGDADFMDGTPEAFLTAAELHARFGTTTLVPTATSGTAEEMSGMEAAFEQALSKNERGADMPGLHLEGPYFSMAQRGAQDPKYVRNPDPAEYLPILARSRHILRWSAAPELPGALEFGRELKRRGILAAIGHTDADYDQVVAAAQAGYSHVTHLYSCMSTVHRKNAFRYAGVVEAAYLLDELTVEVIADGVHLPASLLQFVYRFKGPDKIALVTDSMRGAGMPDGLSVLGSRKNGQQVLIEDGVAKLMDRSAFAGSVATTDRLVRNMIRLGGASLPDAVKMATETPARIMGFADRGRLEAGLRADLVFFDDEIRVSRTMAAGRTVFAQ